MRADLIARLRRTIRGEAIAKKGVTGVSGVTGPIALRLKPPQVRRLRPLRPENGDAVKAANTGVPSPVTAPIAADSDAIEERAALAADCVPACYLDAWARFQCQRPFSGDPDAWWRAIEDGGLFLDAWGADAAKMRWSAGELFDVPSDGRPVGLVWQLKGKRACALGEDRVRLIDGRTFQRQRGDCD